MKWIQSTGRIRSRSFLTLVAFVLFVGGFLFALPSEGEAAPPPLLKVGSTEPDVWDLQYRLSQLGFTTEIDGIFGDDTKRKVMDFQRQYGLSADGIVGPMTWAALKKYSYSYIDVDLLTRLVYSEARGESYEGQVAVAAVVLNRVKSDKFPNTVRGVIFQERAFTAVDDGQFWLTPNETARKAALDAIRGWDPAGDALYYFNPEVATSKWIWSREQVRTIGNHIFAV